MNFALLDKYIAFRQAERAMNAWHRSRGTNASLEKVQGNKEVRKSLVRDMQKSYDYTTGMRESTKSLHN